jgi:protein O-GlcNAc transferase
VDALQRAKQLADKGDFDAAVRVLEAQVRSTPQDAYVLLKLANATRLQNNPARSVHWLKKAVNAAANDPWVHLQAGAEYVALRLPQEAIRRFESILALKPDLVTARFQLGLVYLDLLKAPCLAVQQFHFLLDHPALSYESRFNLGKALFNLGDVDAAITRFRECQQQAVNEGRVGEPVRCLEAIAIAIPGAPSADNPMILADRRAWAHEIMPEPRQVNRFPKRDVTPDRPLNIGYVSSFFGDENWMKPVWGLINQHDRERYRVRLFSYGPVPGFEDRQDAATAFRPHDTDRIFHVDHVDNQRVTRLIEDEEIDVLVDLNGYSDPKRLGVLFSRPAPVVIGWFNMYATTGMPAFDYLIGDRHVVRPEEEGDYEEQILRVPGSYLTFEVAYPVPDVAPAPCLANGYVTFGSLCSRYKLTPHVIRAWSDILRRCPASRLILRNGGLKDASERDYLLAQFAEHGVEGERITLLGSAPHFEFLKTYAQFDIALDTFPYNGGTTTTEAIWQGVPVIAFAGPTWASRTSATLLREGNLADWVANDVQGYIDLAVRWANSPSAASELAELRSNMRQRLRVSSVCDTQQFARSMEDLYRGCWRNWCDQQGT